MRPLRQYVPGPHGADAGQALGLSPNTPRSYSLIEDGRGAKTEIYVDDATMVLWAKSALGGADGPGLNRMAYEVAAE